MIQNLVRMITEDGSAVALACNSTELAAAIERIHQTSAVVTAAVGRLATAAGLMGAMLKSQDDSITLRVKGDGPAGTILAVANGQGDVKVTVQNPVVELPLNSKGKLDVGGAVGRQGVLNVIRDLGLKEPYSGQVPLVSGEIAEDITQYYAISEQIPTVCGLGVLVNPDLTVRAAGGFLVQLLPFADPSCIDTIEQNVSSLAPVSSMVDQGLAPEGICRRLLNGLHPQLLDQSSVRYRCDCSRERVTRALISLGRAELEQMEAEQETTEVSCHFCGKTYVFSKEDLQLLLDKVR